MSKISKEDYKKAVDVIKSYNKERLKDIQHKHKKICETCGSIVESAVAGYCENCWKNGYLYEA